MSASETEKKRSSAAVRAEAAVWLARLHGPNRTPEAEEGFRRWMADDAGHAAAFELLTDLWEKSARLQRRPMERVASWERAGVVSLSFSRAILATAMVAILAVIGTLFYLRSDALVTGVGEQRTLSLEDGTRVNLNTDTRVVVHYDRRYRRVDLEKGEAIFEVARRPDWPFTVTAGDQQIRALGTAFVVRRDSGILAVTLVEGKVTVSPVSAESFGGSGTEQAHLRGDVTGTEHHPETLEKTETSDSMTPELAEFTLSPGQRLTLVKSAPPKLDNPQLERVTAWQRGQVAFDETPLADAVAEMNRYNEIRLVIEDPAAAAIRVSGIFRAGDSANFAHAVARTYRLQVREHRREIILAGTRTAEMVLDTVE